MLYKFARFIIRLVIRLVANVDVHGLERVDLSKACVIASNHLGRLDAALVYYLIDRRDIMLPVAEKYHDSLLWRFFVKSLNLLFVDRFNADIVALRTCLNFIKRGGIVVIAPEGTRSPTASLMEGRPGTGFLAWKAGVPVIPVGISGSEDRVVFPNIRHFRRSRVTLNVGAAIPPPIITARGQEREAKLNQFTTEIMCQIAALLPPEYRGVYSSQPRVEEILNEQAKNASLVEASI